MQGGSYYSKTKGEEMEISTMVDYHARNAFMKQLALRIGELANETRKLSNIEFAHLWDRNMRNAVFQGSDAGGDSTLTNLLSHIAQYPDREPKASF